MKPLVIIGAGGQARETTWLVEDNNKEMQEWDILGYVAEDNKAECELLHYPILGDDNWFRVHTEPVSAICAIGDPKLRSKIVMALKKYSHITFPKIISKYAVVSDTVRIGEGTVIGAKCVVTTNVIIGDFVLCNSGSIVSHDTQIGNFVTMNAGVKISGNVNIKDYVYLGVNSCAIQELTIGTESVIGAGATVIKDIPERCTAVGVPAKIIKRS